MDVDAFINRDDAEKTTFAKAAERYERDVLPSKRGKDQDIYVLKRVAKAFGPYSLAAITPARLSEYRDERLKAVSPQTVIHELGMVSRIFKAASMDWGIALPKGNPISLVRKPSLSNDRDRRLEGDEDSLLLAALQECESPLPHAAAVLAIETAARQSELLSLQWDEINLKHRVARIRGKEGGVTKNGDSFRDVPLSRRAVALLETLPKATMGKVLPLSQNALQMAWDRAMRRARKAHVHKQLRGLMANAGFDQKEQDLEIRALIFKKRAPRQITLDLLARIEIEDKVLVDLHFHDLRHEATSRLAEKLAMHELMKVTGHKSTRMLGRYYHPRAADLAAKLD
ncbi:MAG: site-specific integrase [Rhodoferax sp.]|uniref:site-specific integrase n=1 Tax=Rhodoferax sp. TaxID=50421 RepID=UPI002609E1FA|nr:site-specific integrase [Rhodoferax sp.]MDD5333966.1 site-specific integrase [Rhodoferax sp.]